jgi:hypothetical protein
LIFLAGLVWSLVGALLLGAGIEWSFQQSLPVLIVLIGIGGGAAVYTFGFSKLVHENIHRILALAPAKDKVCLFAFQNVRSYILVAIMMALGYTLRQLSLPQTVLAIVYVTIGVALFLSSLLYYRHLGE